MHLEKAPIWRILNVSHDPGRTEATYGKVLALPQKARARLARLLIKSLDDSEEELSPKEWDRGWKTELDKRIDDIRSGKVKCVPIEEARKRWNKILGRA